MPHRREPRRAVRAELAWAAGVAVVSCALSALALHLWDASMRAPFEYTSDAGLNQVFIKDILENGWYQHNPSLAAPFGQTLYDFPVLSGDNLQVLIIKGLGIFSSDSAWVMNAFFLLTFPLTALTAFGAARLLGVARAGAAVLAILFALLPYHFLRGELHLFIAAYYAVPLGAYLALTAMAGSGIFGWDPGGRWLPALRSRPGVIAAVAVACLVIGSAHVYYAAFTIALLAIAAVARFLARTPRAAVITLVCAATISMVVAANHLPNTIYRSQHGVNRTLERSPDESETYGLKIAAMALPVPNHRLAPLARLRARYDGTAGDQAREGPPQALGTVATAGVAGLLLVALTALAGGAIPARRRSLVLPLAATTLATIVLGTVGGLSSVFAYLATPQLRSWARISIFVAFFGLLAVVLAADHLRRRGGARAWAAALVLILVIGFLDQTNAGSVPPYAINRDAYASDGAFVSDVEGRLGAGASVFQLPYEPFPEPQPTWVPDEGPYDMGRGYLHSHSLRWSWGLMKGRPGDWENALFQMPPALLARGVVAAGFTGIYVDRAGYADGGRHVIAALTKETGTAALVSPDTRLSFIDLRRYAQRLRARPGSEVRALRAAVLRPVALMTGDGVSAVRQDGEARYVLTDADAALTVENFGRSPRRVTVEMTLAPAYPAPADVQIRWPGGASQQLQAGPGGSPVKRALTVPPGGSQITFHTTGHTQFGFPFVTRPYYLRLVDPVVVDAAFRPFGPLPGDRRAAAYLSPFGVI